MRWKMCEIGVNEVASPNSMFMLQPADIVLKSTAVALTSNITSESGSIHRHFINFVSFFFPPKTIIWKVVSFSYWLEFIQSLFHELIRLFSSMKMFLVASNNNSFNSFLMNSFIIRIVLIIIINHYKIKSIQK